MKSKTKKAQVKPLTRFKSPAQDPASNRGELDSGALERVNGGTGSPIGINLPIGSDFKHT